MNGPFRQQFRHLGWGKMHVKCVSHIVSIRDYGVYVSTTKSKQHSNAHKQTQRPLQPVSFGFLHSNWQIYRPRMPHIFAFWLCSFGLVFYERFIPNSMNKNVKWVCEVEYGVAYVCSFRCLRYQCVFAISNAIICLCVMLPVGGSECWYFF